MTRPPMVRIGIDPTELIIDSFAGGGGASEGIRMALGRDPDIAINHNAEAIALHKANHPGTKHYTESVWQVDPIEATQGRKVGLLWLSPDCRHFSRAKGSKPVSKKVRGLAWLAVRWAADVKPRVICLENVTEFQTWGPVLADDRPCPRRKGATFRAFVRKLERLGYVVDWREMKACDFGAPTIRKRLFLVARCDGQPIRWPEPTHGPGRPLPFRTAAECIDFSLPCPSIFERSKPLADKTLARIARGLDKFVLRAPKPFIVNMAHGGKIEHLDAPLSTIATEKGGCRALVAPTLARTAHGEVDRNGKKRGQNDPDIRDPMPTVTSSGDVALVGASLLEIGYGEREGQAARCVDPEKPLGTLVGSKKHALAAAFLAKHFSERPGGGVMASALGDPMGTVTSVDHNALVASHLSQLNGTSTGQSIDEPLKAIAAGGMHFAEVRAFLVAYFGNEKDGASLREPMRTVTSKDRFGLVMVEGVEYAIADIGMRMLVPRELFNAQGFPPSYIIDLEFNGKPLTKTAQVKMSGNSVSPIHAAAVLGVNFGAPGALMGDLFGQVAA